MEALILAGGLGTRLRPLLNDRPKSIAPIAGRPFLEYLLQKLRRHGISDIILSVGYQAEMIQAYFGDGSRWDLQLKYSLEDTPLGTAGAVKLAQRLLQGDTFLVLNGDSFFDLDLQDFVTQHHAHGAAASLALASIPNPQRYGTVEINQQGQILRFLEKDSATQTGGQGLISAGVYLFHRTVLDKIPPGKSVSLERETFPALIGERFYGIPYQAFFLDIGIPSDYQKLQDEPGPLLAQISTYRAVPGAGSPDMEIQS